MKERELRQYATCSICRKPIGSSGLPLFNIVTIERVGIQAGPVRRQQGLAMAMGSAALAMHMGPDEDMTLTISKVVLSVCETCAIEQSMPVHALAEQQPVPSGEKHGT